MGQQLNVLLVEDSEDDAILILRELRRSNFDVVWERVQTAESFCEKLRPGAWDVIIADYQLPRFDAPAALQLLKQSQLDLPFIMVSGTIGERAAVDMMKAGTHDYLMKDNLVRLPEVVWREVRETQIRAGQRQAEVERAEASQALERLNAELEARESQLQDFLDNANDLIQSVSLSNGRFEYVNRAWREVLGYSAEEARTLTIFDVLHSDCCDDWRGAIAQMQMGSSARIEQIELTFLSKNRQVIIVEGSINCRFEGDQPVATRAIFRDITDRKVAEAELKYSRDLRESIFNELADALFLVDAQTLRTLDCNRRAAELFEVGDKAELIDIEGHTLQRKPFSEDELVSITQELQAKGFWSRELEYVTRQGRTFWGSIAAKPITVAGRTMNLVRVTDISDRKHHEAQLQQTNAELARATRLKDEFLANMSHELRTPLTAILGLAEGLQDGVFGEVTERQLNALQIIEQSGTHLLELINDILDVAKIESGQIELYCAPTAVAPLCQASLIFIKQQAVKKRIQLELKLSPNLPDLMVDERRIRQVLINLLNNAVKFTPEGGRVTLEIHKSTRLESPTLLQGLPRVKTNWTPMNQELKFSPWAEEGGVRQTLCLTISDTGIGIAPEHIDKLFQPFIQIDSALNRQYAGTGLGLALVKRIVELHGGTVEVASEIGVGSCFAIKLPCVPEAAVSFDPDAPAEPTICLKFSESDPDFSSL